MSEAALSIKSVDKIYEGRGKGPVHAVKNLDMDVQRGEIVALLGLIRVRQDLDLAHDRRLRGGHARGHRSRGPTR